MATKSLKGRVHALAESSKQLAFLNNGIFAPGGLPTFKEKLETVPADALRPKKLEILQMNLGYMCNQVCAHCHVDAGPDRKEMMSRETLSYCLQILKQTPVTTLDLTGGAPEMHPDFRWFVAEAARIGVEDFIVRSNLTILRANKKYYDLPHFFKKHGIHVVSSLPFTKRKKPTANGGKVFFLSPSKPFRL